MTTSEIMFDSILRDLSNVGYSDNGIPGWMAQNELNWLNSKAKEMQSIVEIGSWLGRSTHALASGCPGLVYSVDHFLGSPDPLDGAHAPKLSPDELEAEFWKNLQGLKNVRQLRMDSFEASLRPGWVDMVFIDGSHRREDVLADLEAWAPKCRKLLCGHDLDQGGVRDALVEYGIKYLRGPGCLWYKERE